MQKHKHLLLNLQQKLTIISTGMVFITFLLIMLMRQWINRPINQLINHIATLEKGDLNAKITVQAGSEIMLLADSLASMSDQLGASRQELQKSHSLLKSLREVLNYQLQHANKAFVAPTALLTFREKKLRMFFAICRKFFFSLRKIFSKIKA